MRIALYIFTALCLFASLWSQEPADASLPKVVLAAENVGPRQIEELTSKSVPRDYAYAWKTMARALAENRSDLLDAYFTGFAKDNLARRIADQKRTGINTRYIDHGHKLEAIFYSPAGDAMQLRDRARVEIQLLDGGNVIHREQVNLQYLVLMTPGADRWLVRDLETTPEVHP
ncbi:MAG: hypothetical protein DMG88_07635 [Acidobacteria bacterium]|nr:MAG: hypothetical protein DMG88_07635 [Acidobacteriota bacterium]